MLTYLLSCFVNVAGPPHPITSTAITCLMCLSVAGPIPLIHGGVLYEVGGPLMSHDIHMLYVWLFRCVAGLAISLQPWCDWI